jgi:hypothetical protein
VILNADLDNPQTLLGPDNGSNSDYDWTPNGLLIRRRGNLILYEDRFSATYGLWPSRRKSIAVTYTHGYRIGSTRSTEVAGAAAGVPIVVPGFDYSNDTLITVLDLDTSTVLGSLTWNTESNGSSSFSGDNTTGHTILVSWEAADTLPADIRLIAVAAAARTWAQDGAAVEATGTYNVTYAGQPGSLTTDECRVLERYRASRRK